MVNKLLLDAAKAYGNWYAASRRAQIATDGVRLATFRFDAVVLRVRNGESAAIDTLEASLEVQRRAVTLAEADVELRAAQMIASAFLWDARGNPVELTAAQQPAMEGLEHTPTDTLRLSSWIASVLAGHPELQKADAKLRVAQAERTLAWQAQLPFAEASLASIADRATPGRLSESSTWGESYKAGLDVQSSLLLLKERGKATRAEQKEEFARLDRDRLRRDLVYGVRMALNDVVLLERLLSVQRANVQAASVLRDAEMQRFTNGESSLLIVNVRERLVLDEAVKLAALEGKLGAARAALVVSVGERGLVP
jgi:outer membrane protein TolC